MKKLFLAFAISISTVSAIPTYSALPASGHFFVIGDYGAASTAQLKIKEMIDKTKPSFIITVGDNCYPDCSSIGVLKEKVGSYYKNYIRSKHLKQSNTTNRFFPTLGNHDWNNTKTAQPYRDFFELPGNERYYDLRVGPVHLFALDSDKREPSGNKKDSEQARWLAEKASASNAKFKIAYFHHAPYSSGHHGSNTDMQWDFEGINIDIVLSGHEHHYERLASPRGATYIISGTGGTGLRKAPLGKAHPWSKKIINEHGALKISYTDSKIILEQVNINGKVVDSFELSK